MIPTPHAVIPSTTGGALVRFGTHYDTNDARTPYVLVSVANDGTVYDAFLNIGNTYVSLPFS